MLVDKIKIISKPSMGINMDGQAEPWIRFQCLGQLLRSGRKWQQAQRNQAALKSILYFTFISANKTVATVTTGEVHITF